MVQTLFGIKEEQSQRFLANGTRIPVTNVHVVPMPVVATRTKDKNGYSGVQVGIGTNKHNKKSLKGMIKEAKLEKTPLFFREIRVADDKAQDLPGLGELINAGDVLQAGDIIDVVGVSKGKGFAGGVKRYHFKGGPRTHGQSDRERAPGSIGQTTTPGRVYKGKRMAGNMGHERVTVQHLQVLLVNGENVLVKGLIPGHINSLVMLAKSGEDKKFVGLMATEAEQKAAEKEAVEETKIEETVLPEEPKEEKEKVEDAKS